MKNLTMTNDNVLIKCTYKNVSEENKKKIKEANELYVTDELQSIKVIKIGSTVNNNKLGLKEGDEIFSDARTNKGDNINEMLGEKVPKEEDKIKIYFYSIKSFNIISIIKK